MLFKQIAAVVLAAAAAGTAGAQAAASYRISRTSSATNATIARETAYEFTTDGRPVQFSYRSGAVLKLPHRLSNGTIEVWAGVTKPTSTRSSRLVLVDGGYYVGSDPHKFGWTLADSGTSPRDPALSSGELAALSRAVGWRQPAAASASMRSCAGTVRVGSTQGILELAKSIRAQGAGCSGAVNLVHTFLHDELYDPQEACVAAAGTSRGCRVDGWTCRNTGHTVISDGARWGSSVCSQGSSRRITFLQGGSDNA